MPALPINGTELNYVEQGTGEPVLMIHGSMSDLRSWYGQIAVLSKRYRAITYSRRFHYPNARPLGDEPYTPGLHAEDLAAVIRTLGIAPAHLVGSSYGGCVALVLAVHHPELVRSMVLGEPPLLPWLNALPAGAPLLAQHREARAAARGAFEQGNEEQGVGIFMDSVLGPGSFDNMSRAVRAKLMEDAPAMRLEVQMSSEDYFPSLGRAEVATIYAPTLLLTGDSSPAIFHLVTDELERCLPNCERVGVPGASHSIHTMNPDCYDATVLEFLRRNERE